MSSGRILNATKKRKLEEIAEPKWEKILDEFELTYRNLSTQPKAFERIIFNREGKSLSLYPGNRKINFPITEITAMQMPARIYVDLGKEGSLKKVLDIVQRFDQIDLITKKDIFSEFKVEEPSELIVEKVIDLIAKGNFSEAKTIVMDAENKKEFSIIAEVIDFLLKNARDPESIFPHIPLSEIYNFCKAVTAENPFYRKARSEMAALSITLTQAELTSEEKSEKSVSASLDENEKSASSEQESILLLSLSHALEGEDSLHAASLLNIYCSAPLGEPLFKDVSCDAPTLIAMARHIKLLQDRNNELTKRLSVMDPRPTVGMAGAGMTATERDIQVVTAPTTAAIAAAATSATPAPTTTAAATSATPALTTTAAATSATPAPTTTAAATSATPAPTTTAAATSATPAPTTTAATAALATITTSPRPLYFMPLLVADQLAPASSLSSLSTGASAPLPRP